MPGHHIIGEGTSTILLNAATTQETSISWKAIAKDRTIQVISTGTADVIIEVSNNGINWLSLSNIVLGAAGNDGLASTAPWVYIRARIQATPSGTVTVILAT